ncbi:hypothetical protein R6Q59_009061 [Mikania micrantha]
MFGPNRNHVGLAVNESEKIKFGCLVVVKFGCLVVEGCCLKTMIFSNAGWLHLQPKWKPSVSWFKNAESRLKHHLSGLFGVSSLAWTGHLAHVAIPASREEYVRWNNFLNVLPHPQGLGPLFTGQWNLYAQNPDSSSHLFGTFQGAGTAILTLLGRFHPQTQSLWLTDIAHHHMIKHN